MNKKGKIFCLVMILTLIGIFLGSCSIPKYPEGLYAEINTKKGKIVAQLEFEKVPMTVANFVGLAEGTIKNSAFEEGQPFFEGTTFHRVVSGHVIQAGIPKNGNQDGAGYTFPNEIHPYFSHGRVGILGMANGGPHTNSNQFYITLGDRSYLDGDYTIFGSVIEGMDVVKNIVKDDVIEGIKIIRIGKKAKKFKPNTESFTQMVEKAEVRVEEEIKRKKQEEEEIISKKWPGAINTESGLKYIIVQKGKGFIPHESSTLKLQYTGELLNGKKFFSTSDKGKPGQANQAEPFIFEVAKNSVNPGFDEAIVTMKKGEKKIMIVPAALAYGKNGFYAKEKKGKKRFVISPNTTLVYEIELLDFQ